MEVSDAANEMDYECVQIATVNIMSHFKGLIQNLPNGANDQVDSRGTCIQEVTNWPSVQTITIYDVLCKETAQTKV
jgi:hypothetical protein